MGPNQTYNNISDAIGDANSGDVIKIYSGNYSEQIFIDKSLTLIGNGTENTTIYGTNIRYVIYINANWVNISGLKILNSGKDKWITFDAGIELFNVNNCNITGNLISNSTHGIVMSNSYNNRIINNNILGNDGIGIYLKSGSSSNLLLNNNCSNNNEGGIVFNGGLNNFILKNSCNSNSKDGIQLIGGGSNDFSNNSCNKNKKNGIALYNSNINIISNNICNINNNDGIYYENSWNDYSRFINNTCNFNVDDGIEIKESSFIRINNNTCYSNIDSGLEIYNSNNIIFSNNDVYSNKKGLFLLGSTMNTIIDSILDKNEYGIYSDQNSDSNIFYNNMISNNTNTGIFILSNCNDNLFYHNQILSNINQVSDFGINYWSNQNQGNYWSNYKGLDNGANGRWKGDGIGDTSIPHPGLNYDNYPFIKPFGWQYPAIPELIIESDLDPDGNYTVSWSNNSRADGFVIEEDNEPNFNSPVVYNNGWILDNGLNILYLKNRNENTYYYRIKSYNDLEISAWSDVVNVTVDYLPEIPKNLIVESIPEGNVLKITWNPNLEDTVKYGLDYFYDQSWNQLDNVSHPINSYIHNGLIDGVIYTYRIYAIDQKGQSSGFSENVNGIPKDIIPPDTPEGLVATPISDSKIELVWNANSDQDIIGYSVFINESETDQIFRLNKTLIGKQTTYIVSGLSEQVTYYFKIKAFDEVPNNSSFSEIASAKTFDETFPKPPTDINIINSTNNSLTLTWVQSLDQDVIGYWLYRSRSLNGEYKRVNSKLIVETNYIDSELSELTYYYYKLTALDDANHSSLFSEIVFGMTLLGAKPPEINNSITNIEFDEDTTDDFSINLYIMFKDRNNDPLTFRCVGHIHINVTIDQQSGIVQLTPEKNWNGQEILTFYANDSMFEIAFDITISVMGVNDPPGIVEIIFPENNSKFYEDEKLEFKGKCSDPDLIYGDILSFIWSSNKDGDLGNGENFTGIKLSIGEHIITLKVKDNFGNISEKSITISILQKNDDGNGENENTLIITSFGIIILFIIVIIFLFLFFNKKKKKPIERNVEKLESKTQLDKIVTQNNDIDQARFTENKVEEEFQE